MKHSILLALTLALAACSDSPEESLASGQKAFAAHDYPAARVHLAAALAGKPGDRSILLLQARNFLALGDGEAAKSALEALAAGSPAEGELAELTAEAALLRQKPDLVEAALGSRGTPEAERLRALAAIQKGNLAGAMQLFEKGAETGGNARLFADYARFKLLSGDTAGALLMADKARKLAPEGLDTLLIDGQLQVRKGDLLAALGTYDKAFRHYPASLAALTGKAAVLGDLGRINDMKAVLDKAATFAPRAPAVLFLRAKAASQAKDWAGVRAVIQPVERTLAPLDPARALYGEALLRLGQTELARAQLEPLYRAMPGNRDVLRLLAEAKLASGDAKGAVTVLRPLADQPYARPDELAVMAKAAAAAEDPKAASYGARSKQAAPQALGRDLADGDAAMRAGNWAGASQAYERLLSSTDGTNIVVLNNMAYAQLMLGNYDRARELADKALKLAPNNPSVLDTAGWVRIKSGKDIENGRRLLRQGAQQAPGNMTIRAHLAEAERAGR